MDKGVQITLDRIDMIKLIDGLRNDREGLEDVILRLKNEISDTNWERAGRLGYLQ